MASSRTRHVLRVWDLVVAYRWSVRRALVAIARLETDMRAVAVLVNWLVVGRCVLATVISLLAFKEGREALFGDDDAGVRPSERLAPVDAASDPADPT